MVYFLRETSPISASARVDLANPISFAGVSSWEWRFRVQINGSEWVLTSSSLTSASNIVFFTGTNTMQMRRSVGENITFTMPNAYNSGAYDYVLSTTGSGLQLTQDGVNCPASITNTDESIWDIEFFSTFGNGNRHGDLYHFEVYKDGALTNNYNKQILNGSNDTVFPDTAGGNDGTLVNFPTDNSQWVYDPTIGRIDPLEFYLNGDNQPAPVVIPFEYIPTQATQGQTLVLTESVLEKMPQAQQDVFWDNVETTGGDLRLTSNQDGTGRLPLELVSIDTTARKIIIWYRLFEDFDGVGNVYLWFGKAGETQPPVTDSFGRNSVWVAYAGMYHFSDGAAIDSSGGNDLTKSGTPFVVSGKIGNATRFDSYDDSFEGAFKGLGNAKRTLSLWVNPDDINQNRYLSTFNGGGKSNLTAMLLGFQSGQFNAFDEGYPTGSAVDTQMSATNSTWQHICYSWDGSRLKGYLNGSLVVDVADTLNTATPDFLRISPTSGGGSSFYTGNMQYFGARNSGIGPNEIATEYANQSDPATFYGTPTLAISDGSTNIIVSSALTSLGLDTIYLDYRKHSSNLLRGFTRSTTTLDSTKNTLSSLSTNINTSLLNSKSVTLQTDILSIPEILQSVIGYQPMDTYALVFEVGSVISIPIIRDILGDWDIEFRAFITDPSSGQDGEFIVIGEDSEPNNLIILRQDNTIDYRINSTDYSWTIANKESTDTTYKFSYRDGYLTLYENGVSLGSKSVGTSPMGGYTGFNTIGATRSSGNTWIYRSGALVNLKITNNSQVLRHYVAPGYGTTLPDITNNENGEQIHAWPSDDSEWLLVESAIKNIEVSTNISAVSQGVALVSVAKRYGLSMDGLISTSESISKISNLVAGVLTHSSLSNSIEKNSATTASVLSTIQAFSGVTTGRYTNSSLNTYPTLSGDLTINRNVTQLERANLSSSLDTKVSKVLDLVVDSLAYTIVSIESTSIKNLVVSSVLSAAPETSLEVLAAKALQSLHTLVVSDSNSSVEKTLNIVNSLLGSDLRSLHSVSTGKATSSSLSTSSFSYTKSIKSVGLNTTNLSNSFIENSIKLVKQFNLHEEVNITDGILIDINKGLFSLCDSLTEESVTVSVDKKSGSLVVSTNSSTVLVILKDFTDSNVLYINSSVIIPNTTITDSVKTDSNIITAEIRITT